MKRIAFELLIERLTDRGVGTVFGIPGDGINGIMEGFRRHQDRIGFVLVQHEEAAAFMARLGDLQVPGQRGDGMHPVAVLSGSRASSTARRRNSGG